MPVRANLLAEVHDLGGRQASAVLRRIERDRVGLRGLTRAIPSAEAYLAAKRQRLDLAEARLAPALATNAGGHRERLSHLVQRFARRSPESALARVRERLAGIDDRPRMALRRAIERRRDRLDALDGLLGALSYRAVLARGYAMVRDADGQTVRTAASAAEAARLDLHFADGVVAAIPQAEPSAPATSGKSLRRRAGNKLDAPARQSSLFEI